MYVADNEQAFESLWIVHLCFPINKEVLVASDVARKLGCCWFSAFHNLSASSYLRFKRDKCFNLFSPDVRVKTATELEVFAVVYSHICCVWNEENTIRYKIKITLPRYDSIQRPLRFRVALVFSVQNAQ